MMRSAGRVRQDRFRKKYRIREKGSSRLLRIGTPPFESMTCIAIAARSSVSEKASCMSVQLVKGPIREQLNLVENPQILSRKVYLKGDIESSYYGIPGMKNLTEFSFD